MIERRKEFPLFSTCFFVAICNHFVNPRSLENGFGKGYPWIKPTDVVRMLHKMKRLDLLLPEDSLDASARELNIFWCRFRKQYPSSTIFDDLSEEQLQWSLPCKIHGDEGRSNLAASEPHENTFQSEFA